MPGSGRVVSGHHRGCDSGLAQRADRCGSIGFDRIRDGDRACKRAVDGEVKNRLGRPVRLRCRKGDVLFRYQARIADQDPISTDIGGDAEAHMGGDAFGLGVGDPAGLCSSQDSASKRVF